MKTTTLQTITLAAAAASFGATAHGLDYAPDPGEPGEPGTPGYYEFTSNATFDNVLLGGLPGPVIVGYTNLHIKNGAELKSTNGVIGTIHPSHVYLEEASTWTVTNSLSVSQASYGSSLSIQDGTVDVGNLLQIGDTRPGFVYLRESAANPVGGQGVLNAKHINIPYGHLYVFNGQVAAETIAVATGGRLIIGGNGRLLLQGSSPSDVSFTAAAGAKLTLDLQYGYGSNVFVQGVLGGSYTGDLILEINAAGTILPEDTSFQIFNDFPVTLASTTIVAPDTHQEFTVEYHTYGMNQTTWLKAGTVVPEPSTYALIGGLGVVALAVLRRRRGKFCA